MKVENKDDSAKTVSKTLFGTVDKIIPAIGEVVPEKAQISVQGADKLYREIRIDNELEDKSGNPVALEEGAKVEVTIAAEPEAATKK
jgi:hypothetical protein